MLWLLAILVTAAACGSSAVAEQAEPAASPQPGFYAPTLVLGATA